MARTIIKIDTDKCNRCGLCVSACHEGTITITTDDRILEGRRSERTSVGIEDASGSAIALYRNDNRQILGGHYGKHVLLSV